MDSHVSAAQKNTSFQYLDVSKKNVKFKTKMRSHATGRNFFQYNEKEPQLKVINLTLESDLKKKQVSQDQTT